MSPVIIIIDFGVGNLRSIQKMFERVGTRALISSDAEAIASAERLILPGVGHFGSTMSAFQKSGLEQPLRYALSKGAALLGLCVGAQMLMTHGDEGDMPGLDLVKGRVIRFDFTTLASREGGCLKIPHMGWRSLKLLRSSSLFADGTTPRFYFTHSYYPRPADAAHTLATAQYGYDFTAVFSHDRIWGVQFHPEKSHVFGMNLLSRFAKV